MKNLNIDIIINGNICLHDLFRKYIIQCLDIVPEKDIAGISIINLYENIPGHIPKDYKGGYNPNGSTKEGAVIDIYISKFIFYVRNSNKCIDYFYRMRERVYIMLFGKIFVAETLLHEIGHHKYYKLFPNCDVSLEEEEKYANEYSNKYLHVRHPLLKLFYAQINRTYHLLYRKRINKAIEVTATVPIYSSEYYNNKGEIYLQKEEYDKAIEMFNKSVDIDNKCGNTYYRRGLSKAYLNNYIDAIADFTSAIDLGMNDYDVYYNRGVCYYNIEKLNEAINDFSEAIGLNYPHHNVYVARSICYGLIKDYGRQNADMQEAIKRGYINTGTPRISPQCDPACPPQRSA